jgi:predicted DNA-binding transcriptional regulator AlpA
MTELMTEFNKDKLLTRKQASEFLGIKENTLAVWKTNRRYPLPVIKVGRLVRYRKSDLITFLEDMTDPQTKSSE